MKPVRREPRFVEVGVAELRAGDQFAHAPKGMRFEVREVVAHEADGVKLRVNMPEVGPVRYPKWYAAENRVWRFEFVPVAA